MLDKNVKQAIKNLEVFIKMCENDLGEDEHKIKPEQILNYKQSEDISALISKLKYLDDYVDRNIFE